MIALLTQAYREPSDAGFAKVSQLCFEKMRKTYRIDRVMRFTLLSGANLPDPVVIALEMLVRHPAAEGFPVYSAFEQVMHDLFAPRGSQPSHMLKIPPRKPFVVRWTPTARPWAYRPVAGATYRFCIYTRGALQGGGAVFYSMPFRFIPPRH